MTSRGSLYLLLLALFWASLSMARFSSLEATLDDSWISFRTARNWIEHGSLTFDLTQPPVEGMTNFLWTIISGLFIALFGGDPIVWMRVLGAGSFLALILLSYSGVKQQNGAGGISAFLLACHGGLAFYALSGLETAFFGLLFTLSLFLLPKIEETSSAISLGIILGLLGWTRPEGVLIGILFSGYLLYTSPPQKRPWLTIFLWMGLIGMLEICRLSLYDSLVPNTFRAKPPNPVGGLRYALNYLIEVMGVLGILTILPALRDSANRLIALVGILLFIGAIWSGGDWMPSYRQLIIPTLSFAWLAGLSFRTHGTKRWFQLSLLCWMGASLSSSIQKKDGAIYYNYQFEMLGRLLAAQPQVTEVALFDIGRFGWGFPRSIYDTAGLTDAHIAKQAGHHGQKEWDEEYFRSRAPEVLIVLGEGISAQAALQLEATRPQDLPLLQTVVQNGGYHYRANMPIDDRVWLHLFLRDDIRLDEKAFGAIPPIQLPAY